MRGKAPSRTVFKSTARITPAYAGKSAGVAFKGTFIQDHPRVCGEKRGGKKCSSPLPGSPPRMRGKVIDLHPTQYGKRITPAYAGKRLPKPFSSVRRSDHPRVCGEKVSGSREISVTIGSPPRMRGKDMVLSVSLSNVRITPAYAGKSARLKSEREPVNGSPPRMRGKGCYNDYHKQERRITPAYAGKSVLPLSVASFLWDHPRVCGEKP